MSWLHISREKIDDEKWNACALSSPNFRQYYLTHFLDEASANWCAMINSDYSLIWPIPYKNRPLLQMYQPLTAQQLGPIGNRAITNDTIQNGLSLIRKKYWRVGVKFNSNITDIGESCEPQRNIELALNQPYASLVKAYNRNSRSNIKKGEKASVTVVCREEFQHEAIVDFKLGRGKDVRALNDDFYGRIKKVYQAFERFGEAQTWVALHHDKPVAHIMLLKTKDRILNFFTSTKVNARSVGAMHLLFDAIIHTYSNQELVLDFEGSNDPNLAFFYESFGGVSKVYLQYQSSWYPPFLN
ncbi:MAG: hypothetical protein Salg2KO_15130 [Salibacteraceae bacterium]